MCTALIILVWCVSMLTFSNTDEADGVIKCDVLL